MNIKYTSSQGNTYIQRKPMNDLTQHKPLSSHLLFFIDIILLYLHFLFTPPLYLLMELLILFNMHLFINTRMYNPFLVSMCNDKLHIFYRSYTHTLMQNSYNYICLIQ